MAKRNDTPPWENKKPPAKARANSDEVSEITVGSEDTVITGRRARVDAKAFGGDRPLFSPSSTKKFFLSPKIGFGIGVALLLAGGSLVWFFHRPAAEKLASPVAPSEVSTPQVSPRLRVFSEPSGAAVFLGSKNLGVTPLEIEQLAPGENLQVELRKEGYERSVTRLALKPGEVRELRLALRPQRVAAHPVSPAKPQAPKPAPHPQGKLSLESDPWAIVYIDNQRIDRITPIKDLTLRAGTHVIRFENPQKKKRHVETIHLAPGQTLRLKVKLQ